MPLPPWDNLRAELGEDEALRLRPWFVLLHYVGLIWRYAWWAMILAAGYGIFSGFRSIGDNKPALDGDFPLLWPIAGVTCFGMMFLFRILRWRLEKRLSLLRAWMAPMEVGEEDFSSPAEEANPDLQIQEQIQAVDEQWQWMRDRLGPEEWGKLVTIGKSWHRVRLLRTASIAASMFYLALIGSEVLSKRESLSQVLQWNPFQLAPFVALLSIPVIWLLETGLPCAPIAPRVAGL